MPVALDQVLPRAQLAQTDSTVLINRSVVFADGFNSIESGVAAGLLARGSDVYYACIPDFWLLRDTKGTGKADVRKKLHSGYGVHIGYLGHDPLLYRDLSARENLDYHARLHGVRAERIAELLSAVRLERRWVPEMGKAPLMGLPSAIEAAPRERLLRLSLED